MYRENIRKADKKVHLGNTRHKREIRVENVIRSCLRRHKVYQEIAEQCGDLDVDYGDGPVSLIDQIHQALNKALPDAAKLIDQYYRKGSPDVADTKFALHEFDNDDLSEDYFVRG